MTEMVEPLVRVENVSKKFCRNLRQALWYGMQDLSRELLGRRHGSSDRLRNEEFWAVQDINFIVRRGECLGVIGANGAGKTTLLRMLNGLIKPDRGRIEVRGRVLALISLGAGFNPLLSARENIYVNASVLGLATREIDERMEEIISFSELGEFIDMPVQSFSSGMVVRLGFATASVLEPDVLLLDEVLAVGDAAFRYKCYRRMDQLRAKSAVIFVSHDMAHVARLCDRALVLSRGASEFIGPALEGIELYQRRMDEAIPQEGKLVLVYPPLDSLEILHLPDEIPFNSPFSADLSIVSAAGIGPVTMRFAVATMAGAYVASCVVDSVSFGVSVAAGRNSWRITFASLPLRPGQYQLVLTLTRPDGSLLATWQRGHRISVTGGHVGVVGDCQLHLHTWAPL